MGGIRNILLFITFFGVITIYWFLTYTFIWIEYCPTFICDPYNGIKDTYDYIIVGGGSAGSVVALRLAEDKDASVLLIEAGPTGGSLLDVPVLLSLLQLSPLDWGYKTMPLENAGLGLNEKVSTWPRGKLIGGTGRFNNMIYARGHPFDFKQWYKNKSDYCYKTDILEYFKLSEDQVGSYAGDGYHGNGGPLRVDDATFITDLAKAVLNAAKELGLPVRDLNGKNNTGFMVPQVNQKNGARYSTGHYLLDNQPHNLKILTNTYAEKILFQDNFEAKSVRLNKFGAFKEIDARRAVVLSAGTIDSAKLLLLSGIGPQDDLETLGIPVISNLPVGKNLKDHITTGTDLFTLPTPLSLNPVSLLSPINIFNYFFNGVGAWTTAQCDALGMFHTNCVESKNFDECTLEQTDPPDLQIMVIPMGFVSDNGAHLRNIIGLSNKIWDKYIDALIGIPTFTFLPILLHPKSEGVIKLADLNPKSPPLINPNYLSDPYDVEILIKGIEFIKKLVATSALNKLGVKMYEAKLPGCEGFVFDTRDYWECYVRHITLTVYHPVGTVKMGHADDPTSVVDYDFKIKGVNKLYVGDASVIPFIPSANINAATVLIAEKAAESIKRNYFYNNKFCNLKSNLIYK